MLPVKNLLPFFFLCLLFSCSKTPIVPDDGSDSQLQKEVQAIDQTLLGNTTDYIMYQGSGIRLAIHSFGNGAKPLQSQSLLFDNVSRLFPSQTVVDTLPYSGFAFNIVPNGLKSSLLLLPQGSKATIFVPSGYGYGPNGSGKIPGNTTVTYEVNLKQITRTAAEQAQWRSDTAAIHQYLKNKGIQASYDSTGIFYTMDSLGTGDYATPFYKITADYSGYILGQITPFQSKNLTNYAPLDLIDGFRIGLGKMKVGNKATIYIPSGLAYGPAANGLIPANAILVFDIKLTGLTK